MVQELLTNALKHAFDDAGGVVCVRCGLLGEQVIVEVADDGTPIDESRPLGVGSSIVRAMVGQLRATLERDGKRFTLAFPLQET